MDGRLRTISLFDHMGFGNMGDAAVLESFIANIKKRLPDARLTAFSQSPHDTKERHDLPCYPIRWCYPGWKDSPVPPAGGLSPRPRLKSRLKRISVFYALAKPVHDCFQGLAHLVRSYKIVRSLDLLIIAGGGQLCDLYGDIPYNVFKFCVLAKLAKTPVCIVGVGADLLRRPVNKLFARWSVGSARYVSFRSVESQALVRSLGVKRETHVCPDPAYGLDPRDYLTAKPSAVPAPIKAISVFRDLGIDLEAGLPRDSGGVRNGSTHSIGKSSEASTRRVGLNPISFCDPRRWPRKDAAVYQRYLGELAAFSSWLLAQNYHLEIFASDIMDVYAMEDLRQKLLAGLSSAAASRVSFRLALTLRELLLQMSTFDFVVTSKFHGVIFSHLLGKPVIALSYLPKTDHLMRAVGHDRYCRDVEHIDAAWLIERFERMVRESNQLRLLFRDTSAAYYNTVQAEFDRLFAAQNGPAARQADSAWGQNVVESSFSTGVRRRRRTKVPC